DDIIGINSKGVKLNVHKSDCDKIPKDSNKVYVSWNDDPELLVNLSVLANDRVGLIAEILNSISTFGINIERTEAHLIGKDVSECNIRFRFNNIEEVSKIINRIKKLSDIKKISINS
ncbi:MAG: ACT domain-containing protein, partial [Nanoarchaeota archaeon]